MLAVDSTSESSMGDGCPGRAGRGGGRGEARAEVAWCQGEGKKRDPEGQEPLSSPHMIWGRKGGEKSSQKRLIFVKTDTQNKKKNSLTALTSIPTHHQRADEGVSAQHRPVWVRCSLLQHLGLEECHFGLRRSPHDSDQLSQARERCRVLKRVPLPRGPSGLQETLFAASSGGHAPAERAVTHVPRGDRPSPTAPSGPGKGMKWDRIPMKGTPRAPSLPKLTRALNATAPQVLSPQL